MKPRPNRLDRRAFLKTTALAAALAVSTPSALAAGVVGDKKIKLGMDNFSVRAMKWKADALIDYAAKLKTDSLFITDLFAVENFGQMYLPRLRQKAADLGLQIHLGTWSICPASNSFRKHWG